MKVSAVILAAGLSKRMGREKLLLDIDGEPVIERFLKSLPLDRFYKVNLTYSDEKIHKIASKYNINCIFIESPELGQGNSIKKGLEGIDEHVMFFSADQPLLKKETVMRLLENYDGCITIPVSNGQRRNPVLFPNECLDDLRHIEGDRGGKVVINSGRFRIKEIDFDDDTQFFDIDDEEDYKKVMEIWQKING